MAAIAISINMDVPVDIIRETIRKFKAVPHRIEYVETINDVIYYNDSKGTSILIEIAIAAIIFSTL